MWICYSISLSDSLKMGIVKMCITQYTVSFIKRSTRHYDGTVSTCYRLQYPVWKWGYRKTGRDFAFGTRFKDSPSSSELHLVWKEQEQGEWQGGRECIFVSILSCGYFLFYCKRLTSLSLQGLCWHSWVAFFFLFFFPFLHSKITRLDIYIYK